MISLILSLSLKVYLNSLVYHRNLFESSSKVFGNLRTSSKIFWKFSENVRESSSGLRSNFGKSSEISGKSSKTRHQYVYIIKRTPQVSLKIRMLCSRGNNNILFLPREHKIHIFLPPCNILYLLYSWRFSRYSASFHWLVHGHMTSNNETVSRQMPRAGNIAKTMTSNGKQFTVTRSTVHC